MNNSEIHVLILASWFPDQNMASHGIFIKDQALLLKKHGYQVTVIHAELTGTYLSSIGKKSMVNIDIEEGLTIARLSVPPCLPYFRNSNYAYVFKECYKVLPQLQENKVPFTLVHSHSAFLGGYLGMRIAELLNIPWVHTEHSSGLIFKLEQYSKSDLSLVRTMFQKAKTVGFVSQFSANRTLENLGLPWTPSYRLLPDFISDEAFEKPLRSSIHPKKFIFIGDNISVKNPSLLMDVWERFIEKYPLSELSIIGNGYSESYMINRFKGTVKILPRQSHESLLAYLAAHDVVLSTSSVETFGLSVAEAQAMGIPAVVTDSGGVKDFITKESGIIKSLDADDFYNGMVQMMNEYQRFDSFVIREKMKNRYASHYLIQELNVIYREAIHGNSNFKS